MHEAETRTPRAEFTLTRHVAAPPSLVWDAFTIPARFSRWFGPRGTTTTVLSHDLRPGGMLHYRMGMPGGGGMYGRLVYRELTAPSRLVWVSSFADEQGAVIRAPFFDGLFPLEMLTTITLQPDGAGTSIALHWTPLEATPAEHRTVADNTASFHGGWTGSFDQLDQFLAEG
jgi:uncharacterized protein YndB with AHSA1/START domain